MDDRSDEINEILEMIDGFVNGHISAEEASRFGLLQISEAKYGDPPSKDDLLVG
ncbi:MAG: hypothetical protein GTO14_21350 [Anaerolineales bacterium]|nr:hypothetical protein [Anaerolineales bacterium]